MTLPNGHSESEGSTDCAPEFGALRQELSSGDLPRHLALFYRTHSEQLTVASAFVAGGLARGEYCLYLADDNDVSAVVDAFERYGIDVDQRRADGQLDVLDATQVYSVDGFDPEFAVGRLEEHTRESLTEGYSGLRAAGENTWSLRAEETLDRLLDFEIMFDEACRDFRATALCQYDVEQFDDTVLGNALQTHERIIYDGQLSSNPYYLPPAEYQQSGSPKTNVELLLEQTRDIAKFKKEVTQREQRLSVINRVLRHNIRNELNVVLGRLDWLREHGLVTDDGSEHLDTMETVTQRLLELSELARHADETLAGTNHERDPLTDVVASVVESAERTHGLAIDLDGDSRASALVGSALETALAELFALVAGETDSDAVALTVDYDHGTALATLSLRVPDSLPEPAVTAIECESEDAFQHSLGLRVWVVRWIMESINGTLTAAEDGGETRLVVTVPTIAASDT